MIFLDQILDFWSSSFDFIDRDCCGFLTKGAEADCWKQEISLQVFRNVRRICFISINKKPNLLLLSVVADGDDDDDFFRFVTDFLGDDDWAGPCQCMSCMSLMSKRS